MDQIDRLFALVSERFKEQKDFADAIGVSPSKVSEWKKSQVIYQVSTSDCGSFGHNYGVHPDGKRK